MKRSPAPIIPYGVAAAIAALILIPGGARAEGPKVGKPAPDFSLVDTDGKARKLSDYKGKVVVLEWFNPDCPVSKRFHTGSRVMAATWTRYHDKGVAWLAICSSAPGKQGNGLERNKQARTEYGVEYPILLDESGEVGRMYEAKTTPHMFVIDKDGKLAYKGGIDDNPAPDGPAPTNYVDLALTQILAGKKVDPSETRSYGCSVKYANP